MDESKPARRPDEAGFRVGLILSALAAAGALLTAPWRGDDRPAPAADDSSRMLPSSPYKNAAPGVAFVGDAACSRCHAEISASFRRHPMGRSMTRGGGVAPEVEGTVFEAGGAAYAIERRDGEVIHRETRPDGAMTEAVVAYVIGSGRRGASFLVERDGALKQSPIAWYAEPGRWDLAPGYREKNQHFDRPITTGCLFCHANRFELAAGSPPVFHGPAIGCERCHGPGSLHDGRGMGADGVDLTIVNPADLAPPLREAVCEQCHMQGPRRVEVDGRTAADFRPGLPFDAFVKTMVGKPGPLERGRSLGQVEQMRQSRCYSAGEGRLGCNSCHDPHRLPDPAERVNYYRDRCLACHADRGCALPEAARASEGRADDCISCHMPRSATSDIVHTSQTLHNLARPARPSHGSL